MSPERRPASTWATGIGGLFFAATMAAARLEEHHHLAGELRVGAAADAEVHVRLREVEVAEEDVAHLRVVVLAGVDEELLDPRPRLEGLHHRGDLHEVRARAHDVNQPHAGELRAGGPACGNRGS
jgi:hypothetical protein